jgi:hypothetical protein
MLPVLVLEPQGQLALAEELWSLVQVSSLRRQEGLYQVRQVALSTQPARRLA